MKSVDLIEDPPAKVAGQIPMRLVTDRDLDWPTLLTQLRAGGADLEVLHADSQARNLDDLRRTEADFTGDDATARRSSWQQMVTHDAETRALRALLPLLRRLAPGTGELQDPRLQDVARIAEAEEAFWQTALGTRVERTAPLRETTAIRETPLPPALSLRAGPPSADETPAIAQAPAEARLRLGQRRWIVARTAFAHVRQQCDEVAAHATAVAGRTLDARIAARYRDLAANCRAVVQALDGAFAK